MTARPQTPYVADLVGINVLFGVCDGQGGVVLGTGFRLAVPERTGAGDVAVALRPRSVSLSRTEVTGSPRNRWQATIGEIHLDRDRVRVTLVGPVTVTAEVTPAALADLRLQPGEAVWASVKAVDLDAYPS